MIYIFFDNVLGKRILLLGETHDFDNICDESLDAYPVDEYLWDLATVSPKCLDIFIERPHYGKSVPKHHSRENPQSPLDQIERKFEVSELPPNLRLHQIDLRHYFDPSQDVFPDRLFIYHEIISEMNHFKTYASDKIIKIEAVMTKYEPLLKTLAKYLIGMDVSQKAQTLYHNLARELSEVAGVPWRYNREYDDKVIQSFHKEIAKRLLKLDPRINKKEFMTALIETLLEESRDFLEDLLAFVMDTYTLLRLFTRFDKSKTRGPSICQDVNIENCIIYSGSYHTNFYYQFLTTFFDDINQPDLGSHQEDTDDKCYEFETPFDFFGDFTNS